MKKLTQPEGVAEAVVGLSLEVANPHPRLRSVTLNLGCTRLEVDGPLPDLNCEPRQLSGENGILEVLA